MKILIKMIHLRKLTFCTSAFGLKVIDTGLGHAVFGAEDKIVDYALLALDEKASLPTQV